MPKKRNPQTSDFSHTNLIRENTAKKMYLAKRNKLYFTKQLGAFSNNTYNYLLLEHIGKSLLYKK